MSTKHRTPQDYPTMKVRGRRRRRLAPYHRAAGAFKRLGEATANASKAFVSLMRSLEP